MARNRIILPGQAPVRNNLPDWRHGCPGRRLSRLQWPPAYTRAKGDSMDDAAGQFLDLIQGLEEIRDAITPQRAHAEFDETTLQVFWKKWPALSAWAGSLWMMLSEELAEPGTPHRDSELDEVGGSD